MARLICKDCENVVMFGGNVKSGDTCPKCGGDNTGTGKTILFKSIGGNTEGRFDSWGHAVKIHNLFCKT